MGLRLHRSDAPANLRQQAPDGRRELAGSRQRLLLEGGFRLQGDPWRRAGHMHGTEPRSRHCRNSTTIGRYNPAELTLCRGASEVLGSGTC